MKLSAYLALATLGCAFTFSTAYAIDQKNEPQLLRLPYKSVIDDLERDYFLYLPSGYEENSSKEWPVLIYLHGDGERGNGKEDLDYVLGYGPLYEAWIQKKRFAVHHYRSTTPYVRPGWPGWAWLHSQSHPRGYSQAPGRGGSATPCR